MSFCELDEGCIARTYRRFPVALTHGEGSFVFDGDGKRYIDMGSGIGVTALGHADAGWCRAVSEQAGRLAHASNLYYTEPCARLAGMLTERTGLCRVFFANSGAEANECAIKVARKHASEKRGIDRPVILTLEMSFHGRTVTTLAATGQEQFHALFQPLTEGFRHVPVGDLDALAAALAEGDVAALLLECVQGEGGVNALSPDYLRGAEALCRRAGALLMVDEVQTGNGRTGTLYAYMQSGIKPDVVTTAKGLGGGLPIGACLLGEEVADILGYGDHGSTFGGNPIAAAGACEVLSRMDDGFLAEVRRKSELVFSTLRGKPGILSVSGLGLMVGIETVRPAAEVVAECIARGVLCLTAKNKVRLLPALNIDDAVLEEALGVLLAVAAEGVEA